MLDRLTPAPGRGAAIAAGAVVLATFAILLDARCAHNWAAGWRLLLFGVIALLIATLAARSPTAQDSPLPYHATLQVAAIVLTGLALLNLADLLGASGQLGGDGELVWTGLLLGCLAVVWARRTNSPIMTLAAALLGVQVLISFVGWAFGPASTQTYRWILLASALGLALGAVWLRDRARRHAVSLVDAAGISILAFGLTLAEALIFVAPVRLGDTADVHSEPPHSVGWKLVILAFAFGLIAYGAVDRERVPPFIGLLNLILFVVLAGLGFTTFVGWPLVLLISALFLLGIGLRPRQELPPEPPVRT